MICLLCLENTQHQEAYNIFDETGEGFQMASILSTHFWFETSEIDKISPFVCHVCWEKVSEFNNFYEDVKQAHSFLTKIDEQNDDSHVTTSDDQLEAAIKEELMDQIQGAINYTNELEEAEVLSECNPLEEAESNLMAGDTEMFDDDVDIRQSGETMTECMTTDMKNTTRAVSNHSSSVAIEIIHIKRRKRCKKLIKNSDEYNEDANEDLAKDKLPLTPDCESKRQKRPKMITKHDEDLIKKHISLGCELCPFVAVTFEELTEHFRQLHDSKKPYVMCCGRKLNKRFLVVQHAYKHEDPCFYKCEECNKVFSDGSVLRSHMLANHAPEEELTFECDQCPKKFSRRYLLELHKPSHIPPEERSFWCKICTEPKVFASDHLLQIHTNMRHTKAPNVCHVCAKEIRDNQAFEKHVRLHFEDSGPRVKCPHPDCDRWLKDEDNLKQHMRRHNDEGKSHICQECGRACKNRRSLTSHINYAHKNEIFSCEECNKTFKKAITLREHMAQHTGETLYKCPFCTRTFNSNANMHAHKKKMHPLEWDNWRKTKRGSSQQLVSHMNASRTLP